MPRGRKPKQMSRIPHRAGRPSFVPTAEQRANVEAMAGYGIPHEKICSLVNNPQTGKPITEPTLRLHFRTELNRGGTKANARVAESLFRKATGDGPGSVIAAIFWLKTRAGWREYDSVVAAGKKEQVNEEAKTAGHGTGWAGDLDFDGSRPN
jgi:hypothetical protein